MSIEKSRRGEHFKIALGAVVGVILLSVLAFMSGHKGVTGYVVDSDSVAESGSPETVAEFEDLSSLSSLSPGTYYIDSYGTVYWLGDSSRVAVGGLNYFTESQKNRMIYIDNEGNLGY